MRSATVRAASRRGWVCPIRPVDAAAELEADLRDLRGLAGAGLARDDDHLVVADRGGDLVLRRADRQLLRVADLRHAGPRASAMRCSAAATSRSSGGERRAPLRLVAHLARAVEPALEPAGVAQHQRPQPLLQLGRRRCWRRRGHPGLQRRRAPVDPRVADRAASPVTTDRPRRWRVLGLPNGVTVCLFDLDGVLTDTARVHNGAWKETFDGFLRERADETGEPFVPFDPKADYEATSTARSARTASATSCQPRDRAARGRARGRARRADGARARQPQERPAAQHHRARRRRGVRGQPPLPAGGERRRAAPGGGVEQRQHRAGARGHRAGRARRAPRRRGDRARARPAGQARARHLPRRGGGPRRRAGAGGRSSRTRWPASRPGGPAASAT